MAADASSFSEVLQTKQVTCLIGPEETPVLVHAGAIARLSEPLSCLINGPQESVAKFPNLEVDDFHRICEYGYRGEYTAPKPTRFSDDEVDVAQDIFRLADPLGTIPYDSEDMDPHESEPKDDEDLSNLPERYRSPRVSFFARGAEPPRASLSWAKVPAHNKSWRENFAPVFLGHARLYAFADQYLIPALKFYAFMQICETLSCYTLFGSGLDAVIQLAEFAYDDDFIPNRDGGKVGSLRIVVAYIIMHLKHFRNFPEHREFLEAPGEYATDVVDFTANWFDPDAIHEKLDAKHGWLTEC